MKNSTDVVKRETAPFHKEAVKAIQLIAILLFHKTVQQLTIFSFNL